MPQTAPVVRHLQQMLEAHRSCGRSDAQLLDDFLTRRDEEAFATLLRRHGPLVLGVCRRVLRRETDAEDAFQATFLALARYGGSIRQGEALAGWLYRVARRAAGHASQVAARRDTRERPMTTEPHASDSPAAEASLRELQSVLNEELDRLPGKYRDPFVLCCLEGKSRREAACALGWKEGTVSGRLAQARQLLQRRLSRRGITLSAGLTALALAPQAEAISAGLIPATVRAGLSYLEAGESAISASVAALLKAVSKTMLLSKTKLVALVLALAGALAGGVWSHQALADKSASPPAEQKPPAQARPPAVEPDPTGIASYAGRVVDPAGRPVAGAQLYLLYYTPRALPIPLRATSDADGRFHFTVAKADFDQSASNEPWDQAVVVAKAEGYGLGVPQIEVGKPVRQTDLTLHLAADDVPVSGRVIDLQGQPVAGVTVRLQALFWSPQGNLSAWLRDLQERKLAYPTLRQHLVSLEGGWMGRDLGKVFPPAVTGPDGRFRLPGVGRERVAALRIEGPTIVVTELFAMTRPGSMIQAASWNDPGSKKETFVGSPFTHVAAPCRPIVGVVRDKDTGKPIPGAVVESYQIAGSRLAERTILRTVTDRQGRYRLTGLPKGEGNVLRARPPENLPYLMSLHSIANTPGIEAVTADFQLKHGVRIRGRVFDKATRGPVHAQVQYFVFEDNPNLKEVPAWTTAYLESNAADGSFELVGLPGRGLIGALAWDSRYRRGVGAEKVRGLQRDGIFRTYPHLCIPSNFSTMAEIDVRVGTDATCELALDSGRVLTGKVLGPDRRPLAGVRVRGLSDIDTWEHEPLESAEFTVTGLVPGKPRLLQFGHSEKRLAACRVISTDDKAPITIVLGPAATLTGRILTPEGRPMTKGEIVGVEGWRPMSQPVPPREDLSISTFPREAHPDKDGRFRIEGLAPGLTYSLGLRTGDYLLSFVDGKGDQVSVAPGKATDLGDLRVKPIK
jgi:RNA polymerase sigma factor (sigma-70 family)